MTAAVVGHTPLDEAWLRTFHPDLPDHVQPRVERSLREQPRCWCGARTRNLACQCDRHWAPPIPPGEARRRAQHLNPHTVVLR